MDIFLVRIDHKEGLKEAAKFLSGLNSVSVSKILLFTSDKEDTPKYARVIGDVIGVKTIRKCHWLNAFSRHSDGMKCPLSIRKICELAVNKKTGRMIFITHLDEIKEILKWAIEKGYGISLDGKIENGSIISIPMNGGKGKKKVVKEIFNPK